MHIRVLFPLYFNDKTEISGNLNRMYSILIDKRASLVSIRQIFEVRYTFMDVFITYA